MENAKANQETARSNAQIATATSENQKEVERLYHAAHQKAKVDAAPVHGSSRGPSSQS